MSEDLALGRVIAVYRAKQQLGLCHAEMVANFVVVLTDELEAVQGLTLTCPDQEARSVADNYIKMSLIDLAEIEKRVKTLDGCLEAADKVAQYGQSAVDVAESFAQTTAMVIVALCVNAYRFVAFARSVIE